MDQSMGEKSELVLHPEETDGPSGEREFFFVWEGLVAGKEMFLQECWLWRQKEAPKEKLGKKCLFLGNKEKTIERLSQESMGSRRN